MTGPETEPMAAAMRELSERQKQCLRLVGRGMSSKEIAPSVGLSPQTVDTYLKGAMARLGVLNRREAARLLAEFEASQNSGSQPSQIVDAADATLTLVETGRRNLAEQLLPPPLGGGLNTLTAGERTIAALRIAAIGTALVIAMALVIAAALRTFA